MSHATRLNGYLLTLLLPVLFLPTVSRAMDLYFYNNTVTIDDSVNYVIKNNVPEDKTYTGALICELADSSESVPESTDLATTLMRNGSVVRGDNYTYTSKNWIQSSFSSTLYYIPLYRNGNSELHYIFQMPDTGLSASELRTGTYNFRFEISTTARESDLNNNLVTSAPFDYTVYSGNLLYNGGQQTITTLTRSSTSMCSGSDYFSALGGSWTAQWWDDHFATPGLCTNRSANTDGYSTDVTVIQDLSLAQGPSLGGNTWSVKDQTPPELSLAGMRLECSGTPPAQVVLDTTLQQDGATIRTYTAQLLTPSWQEDTANHVYTYTISTNSYALPQDGPDSDQLHTGSHSFISTVSTEHDTTSGDDTAQTPFQFTVYSGLLYFNEVATDFTTIEFSTTSWCYTSTAWYRPVNTIDLSWTDIFSPQSMVDTNGTQLCPSRMYNPDGYSVDLSILSGEADFGDIETTVSGMDVELENMVLDSSGGTFSTATITLPEDVTVHQVNASTGYPLARGQHTMVFSGSSFTRTLETVTLMATPSPFLHGYGLPFYIGSTQFSLDLYGSSGLIASNSHTLYVHQEAINSLAADDLRKFFPSNDIVFLRDGGSGTIVLDQNGLGGTLPIKGYGSLDLETSFPRAFITFADWDLKLSGGTIDSTGPLLGVQLFMRFGQGCRESADCSGSGSTWYRVAAEQVFFNTTGAYGAKFADLGPNLDQDFNPTGEDSVEWGALSDKDPSTFVRHDRSRQGAFLVPGFIMPGTSETLDSPYRLGQVLLGAYGFSGGGPDTFLPLNDAALADATLGNGIFPGLNLGPEKYTTQEEGIGAFLNRSTWVHFYEPPSSSSPQSPVQMDDRRAVKYVLRPGGLTGVFNTSFNVNEGGLVNIYGYDLAFDRFAFRQDRNRLDSETFIDGSLTLHDGPVAWNTDGSQEDFEVSFVNLDLTCNGNLGSGTIDAQPEPDWPDCSGEGEHRACQTLAYWNMPVLLAAMGFANDPDTDPPGGMCPSGNRLLTIDTRNQVDGLGQSLAMSGMYTPTGTIEHQKMSGEVETWFDKPPNGDDPGFGIRLRSAYLNEISPTLPSWSGFTVLAGLTDVPLFNDTRLAGQFDNRDIDDPSSYDLFVFQDETDNDGGGPTPRDGVPDNYQLDVPDYRALLRPDNPHPPSPYFEYSWPTSSMVDLNYYAQYTRASGEDMPLFNGIRKDSDIMKVIQVHSVPDYINPQKTKFSFGASADLAEMQKNFQIDPGNITGSVDTFLHNVLHVPDSFSLDSVFCPTGVCLHDLEDNMRDMTGGDLLVPMGKSLDTLLQQPPLDSVIRDVSRTLTLAHQAPAQVSGILLQPMRDTRNALLGRISTQMTGSFSELYSSAYLAALAVYDNDQLLAISTGRPTDEQISAMLISVNAFRTSIDQLINRLDSGVIQYTSAVESLTRPVDGAITTLLGATQSAREALSGLGDALDQNLSGLASPDPQVNPLLGKVDEARQNITQIRNVIAAIDFGPLGTVLQQAAALSGASIDTSLIDAARQTIDSALAELDGVIAQADAALQAAYGSLPLSGILSGVHDLIKDGPTDNLYGRLKTLAASLQAIQTRIRQIDPLVRNDLNTLQGQLAALRQAVASSQPINSSITSWSDVQSAAQIALDTTAGTIFNVQNQNFATLFESKFSGLIGQPFTTLLEDTAAGGLAELLDTSITAVTAGLPQPSENDIRNMIRIGVLNTNPVDQVNQVFFSQFGLLSDQLDTISTAMTDRMNELIRQTVDAVNQSMSDQLAGSKLPIGGGDWGLRSVGIDGYALVSQDEFERIHMGAEFVFGQDPDPTSYNAALDVTSWKADNGKTGCVADPGNYFDVTISTHDVTADMLGMDVGIKTAMLGFTINSNSGPVGVLGNCYLAGNINFEVLVLEDLGLEVGVGAQETYFGATGAGRFQEYRIPKAAFFVGRSCDFAVLERLDPEIAEFIGPLPKLEGIYARGSVSVPIYNGGCWFTVGAGVDVGAWYFADPSPGTYGGLFGGSAYGSLGCLASIKGMLRCIGQKSGGDYKFNGSGWAGAGIGFCSPGSWQNVGDVRGDSWCLTGDASFTATYLMNDGVSGDLSITGPDVHCCD